MRNRHPPADRVYGVPCAPPRAPRIAGQLSSQLPGVLAADTESPLGVALTQDCAQPDHREPFQASSIQGWGRAESPQAQTLPPWATRGEGRAPAELPVGRAEAPQPRLPAPFSLRPTPPVSLTGILSGRGSEMQIRG